MPCSCPRKSGREGFSFAFTEFLGRGSAIMSGSFLSRHIPVTKRGKRIGLWQGSILFINSLHTKVTRQSALLTSNLHTSLSEVECSLKNGKAEHSAQWVPACMQMNVNVCKMARCVFSFLEDFGQYGWEGVKCGDSFLMWTSVPQTETICFVSQCTGKGRYIPFSLAKGWNLDAETSQWKPEHQIGSEIQHSTLHGVFLISQPVQCSKQTHRKGHILCHLSMGMNIDWGFSGIGDSAQIFLQWVEKGRRSTLGWSRCAAADLVGLFRETPFSICLVPHPSLHLLLLWSWATFTHSDNAPNPLQGLIWFVQQ